MSSKRILIVEDDSDIARNLKEILEGEGYEAVWSANGHEALIRMRSEERLPSLILLDLMMPVMDGFKFREVQMRDERLGHIPVVVITAVGCIEETKTKISASAFLKKPPELDAVLSAVDRYIL